jgi:hypothetical protein
MRILALTVAMAAIGILLVQPVFAGGAAGRGAFTGSSTYTCKSSKQVPNKKACKEFGGKNKKGAFDILV